VFLCQRYDCHINLEVCTSILAVKYLYKYVTKGSDRAVMTGEAVQDPQKQRQEPNEVLVYINDRYISSVEACTAYHGDGDPGHDTLSNNTNGALERL
jgi:hypothetical protein